MAAGNGVNAERLSRLFDVLELLVGHPAGMSVTEISKRLELPISSAHNLLQRLVAAEVIVASEGPRYSVGTRLVRLAIRTVDGLEISVIARKYLHDLARDIGDDVYLAVRLGKRVVYVVRVPGTRPVTVDIRLGQSLFLHATSVGKLFAAYNEQLCRSMLAGPLPKLTEHTLTEIGELQGELERVRQEGFAVSREEAIVGIVGVALPVLDAKGELAAAVHVSALRAQMDDERLVGVIDATRASARAIEKELGR